MDEWKKVVIVVVAVLFTIVVIFCAIVIAGKLINQQQPTSTPETQSEMPAVQPAVTEEDEASEPPFDVSTCTPFNPKTGEPLIEAESVEYSQCIWGKTIVYTPTPEPEEVFVQENNLENPVMHHDGTNPAGQEMGAYDIGVHSDQIGVVFGVHVRWTQGGEDAGGDGCDLVLLMPGWYENLEILDGRFEVYTVPTSDYLGWVEVLATQRSEEQASNYGCSVWEFDDIPQWESSILSPP